MKPCEKAQDGEHCWHVERRHPFINKKRCCLCQETGFHQDMKLYPIDNRDEAHVETN